jgi:hypothetical protein
MQSTNPIVVFPSWFPERANLMGAELDRNASWGGVGLK